MRAKMMRPILMLLIAGAMLAGCTSLEKDPPVATRNLVQAATKAVTHFTTDSHLKDIVARIPNARAVAVFPLLIKAGLVAGGEGGNGVIMARNADGTWTGPTFISLGAASFGLQAGIQATEVILIIRSEDALKAVLKNQGSVGADTGMTVAIYGAGVESSTTTNLGADIFAFANSRGGLYGGFSLEGAVFVRRRDLNEAYYGPGATPEAILAGQLTNPDADPLKQALAAAKP